MSGQPSSGGSRLMRGATLVWSGQRRIQIRRSVRNWMYCASNTDCSRNTDKLSGSVVARHRRPPLDGTPPELLEFRGDDWIGDGEVSPYWAWLMARFEWAKVHPGSPVGSVLDVLRERRAYGRGLVP
jgi:hypothetical protein